MKATSCEISIARERRVDLLIMNEFREENFGVDDEGRARSFLYDLPRPSCNRPGIAGCKSSRRTRSMNFIGPRRSMYDYRPSRNSREHYRIVIKQRCVYRMRP